MKAILVMDMPSSCLECPIGKDISIPIEICIKCPFEKCVIGEETKTRPDWCPLKQMPEKKKERYGMNRRTSTGHWETYGEETDSFATGYNTCIDEILGDKE